MESPGVTFLDNYGRLPLMLPRNLNNALQARLSERGLSFKDLPELASLIDHYLAGHNPRQNFIAGLERILRQHTMKIPRKGARGGYDHIGRPEDRLQEFISEILTILDCGPPADKT
jgi:hypothetical protein